MSDWAETWWEALEHYRGSESLESFRSYIQDGRNAILKIFKRHLLRNRKSDWSKTLWEASERHRDSELLELFRSDLQDGRQFFKITKS